MNNDHFKVRLFFVIAGSVLAVCQALPVGLLPQPTPSPEIFIPLEQAGAGPSIHGQVLWGTQPVPDAIRRDNASHGAVRLSPTGPTLGPVVAADAMVSMNYP